MKKKLLLLSLAALCAAGISAKKGISIGVEAGYDFAHYRSSYIQMKEAIQGSYNTKIYNIEYRHSTVLESYTQTVVNGKSEKSNYVVSDKGRLPQMHGFHIGPTFDARFAESHGLGLRFALQYQFLTTNGHIYDSKKTRDNIDQLRKDGYYTAFNTTMHSLDIPIRLSYTWTVKDNWNIWVMTGPKLNIGLVCKSYVNTNIGGTEVKTTTDLYSGIVYVNGEKTEKEISIFDRIYPFDASWGLGFGFGYKNFNFSACYDLGITSMNINFVEGTDDSWTTRATCPAYNNQLQLTLSYTFPVKQKASAAK